MGRVWLGGGVLLAVLLAVGIAGRVKGSGPDLVVPTLSSQPTGELAFTTYSPPTVQTVRFSYRRGQLSLGQPNLVARLPGADGIAYTPSGNLVVGGQNTSNVFLVNPTDGRVSPVAAGSPAAFLVVVDPAGDALYTAGLPGKLDRVPLHPPGPGRQVPLTGDDTSITGMAFGPDGQVLYTASGPGGVGDIGKLDLSTGRTTRLFSNTLGAHGITYDPFSRSYMVIGGQAVLQIPPSDPTKVLSERTVPGVQFDQVSVSGTGLAFLADNYGSLVLIDYSKTGRVGDTRDVVQSQHLIDALDDVAPLIGAGARPVATAAPTWRKMGDAGLAGAGLLAVVLGGMGLRNRSANRRRRLPKWDRRRQSGSASPSEHEWS